MKKKNVNYVAQKVLNLEKDVMREIKQDVDFFENVDGELREELACNLLIAAQKNRTIEKYLQSFFWFSNKQTISDRVFQLITEISRSGVQRSIFIALAHCEISFYQMEYIARQKVCFEAFAWMLRNYLLYQCFSVLDVERLMSENLDFLKCIDWEAYLTSNKCPPSKKRIIELYISK